MSIMDLLIEAIDTGEILELVYDGGSHPGQVRQLSPVNIVDDGKKVLARCYTSGPAVLKTFNIDKLRQPSSTPSSVSSDESQVDLHSVSFSSPAELFAYVANEMRPELPETVHVDAGNSHVSLHLRFKNGKPKKMAFSILMYKQENRVRPWFVKSSNEYAASTLSKFSDALELFISESFTIIKNGNYSSFRVEEF